MQNSVQLLNWDWRRTKQKKKLIETEAHIHSSLYLSEKTHLSVHEISFPFVKDNLQLVICSEISTYFWDKSNNALHIQRSTWCERKKWSIYWNTKKRTVKSSTKVFRPTFWKHSKIIGKFVNRNKFVIALLTRKRWCLWHCCYWVEFFARLCITTES